MASDEAPKPAADRIRVVGKWVGALEVDLGAWTVPMLRAEVARRVGDGVEPERVGLIFGGRVLKDEPPASLREAGLKANAKVLSSLASPDRAKEIAAEAAKAKAEEEHAARLVRLWDAAKAMSQRHTDGSFLEDEDYNLDLEDQSGQKVMFGSVDDMKALKMALMLHQKGKTQMKKKKYKEALDVLIMAEVCCLLLSFYAFYLAYVIVYCKKPVQILNCYAFYSTKFLYTHKFFVVFTGSFLPL